MKILDSRSGYNLYAPNYRKDHTHLDSFDWNIVQPILAGAISTALEKKSIDPLQVLDLGCGDGRVLKRLVRLREQREWSDRVQLHGWDISDGMLKQARKALPSDVQLMCHDLLQSEPTHDKFDLICSFFVLVHIADPYDFLKAASAVLKHGAIFIFNNIPQKEALVLESNGQKFRIEYEHHESSDVLAAFDDCGLELIEQIDTEWSQLFTAQKRQAP